MLRHTLPNSQLTSALVNESSPTHCGFTLAEGVAGWEALRAWVAGAPQPKVSDLQNTCNAAVAQGAAGPCRYDASITVPSFDSQVRPRQASTAPPVDAHYSGQWYDPPRAGEGISLEILSNGKAAVYFFTDPPKDVAGKQTWLFGVGDVVGNGIEFADVQLPALDVERQNLEHALGPHRSGLRRLQRRRDALGRSAGLGFDGSAAETADLAAGARLRHPGWNAAIGELVERRVVGCEL